MSEKRYEHSLLASVTITKAAKDGEAGPAGNPGITMLTEEWAAGRNYRNDMDVSAALRIIHRVHLAEDSDASIWYVAKAAHNDVLSSESNKPGTAGGAQYWERFNNIGPIYTTMLWSRLIKAEEIDVESVRVKMIEAGLIRADEIDVDNLSVKKLDGAVGSFKTLQCIDSNGDVAGELKFYSGYMQFNGKFSIIGDLSATLVQGHTLSHSSTPTIVVYGSYVRYYERGPNSTYTTSYLAVDGANVYTIELIRLGICYNTIIIAYTSGTYNYELNTYRTGEVYGMNVTVINPNDNAADGSTVFWLNGKSRIIRGGGGYILSRTNPSFLNPSLPAFSRGGGWFVVSEFDNDWR